MGFWSAREVQRRAGSALLILAMGVGIARGESKFAVTSLGKQVEDAEAGSLVVSLDSKHVAYIRADGTRKSVVVDGVAQGPFDDVPEFPPNQGQPAAIRFSPDSQHVAYVAQIGSGAALVFDGKAGKTYQQILTGRFVFSPDSKHLAYVAGLKTGRQEKVVYDGVEGKVYEYVKEVPVFSGKSGTLFYIAYDGEQMTLVKDGKEIARAGDLGNLSISTDEKRIAYMQMDADYKCRAVVNGVEGTTACDSLGINLLFSQDGIHLFYMTQKGDDLVGVLDGVESSKKGTLTGGLYEFDPKGVPAYLMLKGEDWYVEHGKDEFGPYGWVYSGISFTPDAKHMVYAVLAKGTTDRWMVIDGKDGEHFDYLLTQNTPGQVDFSADGTHSFYQAARNQQFYMVIDGVSTKVDGVFENRFSPDGKHLAVSVKRGDKSILLVDGKNAGAADVVWAMAYSPDSKHLACLAHQSKKVDGVMQTVQDTLMVDGTAVFTADQIGRPRYTADGKHLVMLVRRGKEWRVRVDGEESPVIDDWMAGADFVFDSPDAFHILGIKGGEYVRVDVTATEK